MTDTSWLIDGDEWWPVDTPFGRLILTGNEAALHRLFLPGPLPDTTAAGLADRRGRPAAVAKAEEQLRAYCAGELRDFDLPLEPRGTAWQQAVWQALTDIPYGRTASYGEIAARVGNPRASRAVGMANNRNPIALIIPCHRVIGTSGSLVGYGGGLELKESLLSHERAVLAGSGR
jgi:methylated-DNA-[protein]-cysteine S-methyltransferase